MFLQPSLPSCLPGPEFAFFQQLAIERQRFARAPGTVRNHKSTVSLYVAFCLRIGIDYLNPDYQEICSFIEYIAKYASAPSTIRNKISQVRVFILLADGLITGFSHPRTERALDAIDRNKSYMPRVKLPIPPGVLKDILLCIQNNSLGCVACTAMLFIYYGALRQSELMSRTVNSWSPSVQPTCQDCGVGEHHIVLHIKTGKNLQKSGQFREIILNEADEPSLCPVRRMRAVLAVTPTLSNNDPLFMFPANRAPLTSTFVQKQLHATMSNIGMSHMIPQTTLHSLRKAAATNAFTSGCSELSIKQYGGWLSSAYQSYISTSNTHVNRSLITSLNK